MLLAATDAAAATEQAATLKTLLGFLGRAATASP